MEDVSELVRNIEKISGKAGQSIWTTFTKFLDVSLEATQKVKVWDMQWEPELGVFEKARQDFYEGYAILLRNMYELTYQDVIGSAYMQINIANKRAGQFFTPWNIAKMMAEMIIGEPDLKTYTPQRPMTICDPCVGSGILLLAAASVLPRSFIDEGRVLFYGMDIDETCVKMACLNASLYGLDRPSGFVKPTQELTEKEIQRIPEPYKTQVQQTLFDLGEGKKAA